MEQKMKPIVGGWFIIYWLYHPAGECQDLRYDHWDRATHAYTPEQWDAFMKDLSDIGQKYLVLVNTFAGVDGRDCIYDSKFAGRVVELGSKDPLEVVLSAADRHGMKIFMTHDYYNSFLFEDVFDETIRKTRLQILEELAEKYGHHKSFYGWYIAREAHISPYYPEEFITFVNDTTAKMRSLKPDAKILLAPYGTASAICDDKFIDQLRRLDCDIIAYQDCVGCKASTIEQNKVAFANLRKAHDAAGKSALWADVETFDWDNGENRVDSRLISTSWERLKAQIEACSPYVDEVLAFAFQGLMTKKDSIAYCGYEEGARLYDEYMDWLKAAYPEMIKE